MDVEKRRPGGPFANANIKVESEIVVRRPDGSIKQKAKGTNNGIMQGLIDKFWSR
jgi:hypothetical protein